MRERYVGVLLQELPPGARVLELGCGAGVPIARALAQRFDVTGVDISARQIELARQHVPQARFVQADMAQLDLPPESYDGIAAFYALFHIPREQQPRLLANIASWLRPGGLLVATMGIRASKGDVEEDWLGAPMYWSSYDSETNVRLVREAGLEIVQAREETVEEHGEQVDILVDHSTQAQRRCMNHPFVKGLELSGVLYETVVKPILAQHFSDLPYSAALIGRGSEVLGFDTSTVDRSRLGAATDALSRRGRLCPTRADRSGPAPRAASGHAGLLNPLCLITTCTAPASHTASPSIPCAA